MKSYLILYLDNFNNNRNEIKYNFGRNEILLINEILIDPQQEYFDTIGIGNNL